MDLNSLAQVLISTFNKSRIQLPEFKPHSKKKILDKIIIKFDIKKVALNDIKLSPIYSSICKKDSPSIFLCISRYPIDETPRKKFLRLQKIYLNQTNLCIAVRPEKSFFDLKKFLDFFSKLKISHSKCVM